MIRFKPNFSDDYTEVTFVGPDADIARNILCTRLLRLECEVEIWDDDEEEWKGVLE